MTIGLETPVGQCRVAPRRDQERPVRVRPCEMVDAGCMVGPVPVHEQEKDYSGLEGLIGRPGNIRPKQRLIVASVFY